MYINVCSMYIIYNVFYAFVSDYIVVQFEIDITL